MIRKFGKVGVLFLALVIALAGFGASYALWSQDLTIQGTVETGELDWEFTVCSILDPFAPPPYIPGDPALADYTCRVGFEGPPPFFWHSDKNVGWGECAIDEGNSHVVEVNLYNVYPCYFNSVSVYAWNTGSIPLIIEKVIIDGNEITSLPAPVVELDLSGDGKADVEIWWGNAIGTQLEPGDWSSEMSFWFHCLQDAPEGATLSFTIELVGVQWNESSHLP